MQFRTLDCVMYRVGDLQDAVRFYEEQFGLRRLWSDMSMVGLGMPESTTEVVVHTDSALPRFDHCYLVDDVEIACAEYFESGGTVKVLPVEVRCGKYAVLLDPYGNRLPIIDLTKFGGEPRYDS